METGRRITNINDSWRFSKLDGGLSLNHSMFYDDSQWQEVTLPHTWNAEDGSDGWASVYADGSPYYRGKCAYCRTLLLSGEDIRKKLFIEFEGANTITELYVNSISAGVHEGGYGAFRFDITDLVVEGENQLTVTVDNSTTNDIAPINREGDFTKMGGIYRGVSLIAVDGVHIDLMDYGSLGVYLTPYNIKGTSADLNILVKVKNDTDTLANAEVSAVIYDAEGKGAGAVSSKLTVPAGAGTSVQMNIPMDHIHLWNGVVDPYLYSCEITITSDEYVDKVTETTGFRTYSVDNGRGILLNGERIYLKGVNYHQDSFENGWAMTDEQRERDYAMLRRLGANAVRMAHYQHASYEYNICDLEGLIVYSEIPLINRTTDDETKHPTERFQNNIKQQLIEMIRQNYNHPSILFWGISNELYDVDKITRRLYAELVRIAKQEDPTRHTIYADNVASEETMSRSEKADLVGYNRYDGWYYSRLGGMSEWVTVKSNLDGRPVCVSEYGGGAALTQHMDEPTMKDIDPNGKRHPEEYQSIVHEETWADLSSMQIFGSFIWCMFDFASDTREEGDTKGLNDKGLVTRDRVEKDAFYFYQSVWTDEPMVHITSKRFTERPYEIPIIKVYSNASCVELLVDGVSKGVIQKADLDQYHRTIFKWENIIIKTGEINEIKAVATFADKTILQDNAVWSGIATRPCN